MKDLIENDPTIESHRTAGMPLPRSGTLDEVAEAILFLASDLPDTSPDTTWWSTEGIWPCESRIS